MAGWVERSGLEGVAGLVVVRAVWEVVLLVDAPLVVPLRAVTAASWVLQAVVLVLVRRGRVAALGVAVVLAGLSLLNNVAIRWGSLVGSVELAAHTLLNLAIVVLGVAVLRARRRTPVPSAA